MKASVLRPFYHDVQRQQSLQELHTSTFRYSKPISKEPVRKTEKTKEEPQQC